MVHMILCLTQVTMTYNLLHTYVQASESTEGTNTEAEEVLQLDSEPSKATPEEENIDEHQEL